MNDIVQAEMDNRSGGFDIKVDHWSPARDRHSQMDDRSRKSIFRRNNPLPEDSGQANFLSPP